MFQKTKKWHGTKPICYALHIALRQSTAYKKFVNPEWGHGRLPSPSPVKCATENQFCYSYCTSQSLASALPKTDKSCDGLRWRLWPNRLARGLRCWPQWSPEEPWNVHVPGPALINGSSVNSGRHVDGSLPTYMSRTFCYTSTVNQLINMYKNSKVDHARMGIGGVLISLTLAVSL